jgi:hypothetical protein
MHNFINRKRVLTTVPTGGSLSYTNGYSIGEGGGNAASGTFTTNANFRLF